MKYILAGMIGFNATMWLIVFVLYQQ